MNPHQVTRDFEAELCRYTGAPYAVAVNSCTMALLLAVAWHLRQDVDVKGEIYWGYRKEIEIPKRTYVGVPMSIIHAGGRPTFRDEDWVGAYQLKPLPVWDSARRFTSRMYYPDGAARGEPAGYYYTPGQMVCVSFHAAKILGDTQGGAILHDDPTADLWFRRARFDGRMEDHTPSEQARMGFFTMLGWHAYMSPDVAARLLWKLSALPKHNEPLANDDYPDLSQLNIFR